MFAHLRVTRGNESIFQFKVYGSVSYPRQYCNIYGAVSCGSYMARDRVLNIANYIIIMVISGVGMGGLEGLEPPQYFGGGGSAPQSLGNSLHGTLIYSHAFFVSAPKCRDVVLGSSVRTWYAFSSTRAMPRAIRRPTPTIIAHSMNKTLEGGRQEGKPRRDSSIAIDRQPVNKKPLYSKG